MVTKEPLTPEQWREIGRRSAAIKEAEAGDEVARPELLAEALSVAASFVVPSLVATCEALHTEVQASQRVIAAAGMRIRELEEQLASLKGTP